jgi:hypothetical protein
MSASNNNFLILQLQTILEKNIFWNFSDETITQKKLTYYAFLIWFTF